MQYDNTSMKIALGLTITLCTAACTGASQKATLPSSEQAPQEQPPQTVVAYTVNPIAVIVPIRLTGSTKPVHEANLGTEVTARIAKILVKEGDTVKADQALIQLDDQSVRLNAAQAQAQAAAAEVQARQTEIDYQRLAPLAETGAIASSKGEQLKAQFDAAREAARSAKAAAEAVQRLVTKSVLRAPFAGTVASIPVEAGEIATMMPPTILIRLVALNELEVTAALQERDLWRTKVGDPVSVRFPNANMTAEGKVVRIGSEIDPRTRSAEVVAHIPNPDGKLRAGMFAELEIKPSTEQPTLVIPRSAIITSVDQEQQAVYVISSGHARKHVIRTNPVDEERFEVVEGLKAGEHIVAKDVDRLEDGVAVTATKPTEVTP